MFEFMAKRINVQLSRLKKCNPNAFMFIDEPGLQFLFSALKLRVGMRAEPVRPAAGFEIQWQRWRFHYGGDLHPDLGASHEMGLEFMVGR